jgi:CHASE2 domain-containing sensor protein
MEQPLDKTLPRGKRILRHLVKGVCFTMLVLVIKLSVEYSPFGHELERMSFDFLQHLLSAKEVPVYVVDISTLKPREINRHRKTDIATPREELQMLIAAIADEKPKVIGVDIDFAPDKEGFITPGDPAFFAFCRGLRQTGKKAGVPVFLGVERSVKAGLPPDVWLGNKEYAELAACIIIPKQDTRKIPLRILERVMHFEVVAQRNV